MALVPWAAPAADDVPSFSSLESFATLLTSQQELFLGQAEQLERLVVAQCRLTGVNPLAQEMAAGALSVKIGKRPRDLLNPKAIKYMQSIFSIKDTIGKKETREISALCGVTATQVRDFITSQRSRVRKLVHLSQEKGGRLGAIKAHDDVVAPNTDDNAAKAPNGAEQPARTAALPLVLVPVCTAEQSFSVPTEVPDHAAGTLVTVAPIQVSVNSPTGNSAALHQAIQKANQHSSQPALVQDQAVPCDQGQKFLDNMFAQMRKEESFSGQVKLLERILRIHDAQFLARLLTMGCLSILARWLSEAATEEQTSVLAVIFKVLSHLPLHKALPLHMSTVLQSLNKLRFYRTSDISNRAKMLLSRLSKILVKSQSISNKKLGDFSKDSLKEMICKQRINEILRDDSWRSEIPEEILVLTDGGANDNRKLEPKRMLKLLPASGDDSIKRNPTSVSAPKPKERRKVQLVEQPQLKAPGVHVSRSVATKSRPLSADDIQKAKMRETFLRDKYGKAKTSKDSTTKPSNGLNLSLLPLQRNASFPNNKRPLDPSHSASAASNSAYKYPRLNNGKPDMTPQEQLMERVKLGQIHWRTPPELHIDPSWQVAAGESSKEVENQGQRNRRESETIYEGLQDVPLNPKDPWDVEMDYDDSLTVEIPIDQPPEAETIAVVGACITEAQPVVGAYKGETAAASAVAAGMASSSSAPAAAAEPDLELLAVLLKNPDLVYALTSGQAQSLPAEQTVALLDVLKRSGLGLADLAATVANTPLLQNQNPQPERQKELVPVSLPSPTPPSNSEARANWRSEFPTVARAPVLQTPPAPAMVAQGMPPPVSLPHSTIPSYLPSNAVAAAPMAAQLYPPVSVPQQNVMLPSPQPALFVNTMSSRVTFEQHPAALPARVPLEHAPALPADSRLLHEPVGNMEGFSMMAHSNAGQSRVLSNHHFNSSTSTLTWPSSIADGGFTLNRDGTTADWMSRAPRSSLDVLPPPPNTQTYIGANSYNSYSAAAGPTHMYRMPSELSADRNDYMSEYGARSLTRPEELRDGWGAYPDERNDVMWHHHRAEEDHRHRSSSSRSYHDHSRSSSSHHHRWQTRDADRDRYRR